MSETHSITVTLDHAQVLDCLPRCKTCKHFRLHTGPSTYTPEPRHECEREELNVDTEVDGLMSFQPPSPDFGCLLWEEKGSDG